LSITNEDKARILNDELENYMEKLESEPAISENDFTKLFPRYTPGQFSRTTETQMPKIRRRASDGLINISEDGIQLSPIRESFQPLAIKNRKETDDELILNSASNSPRQFKESGGQQQNNRSNSINDKGDFDMIESWKFDK
jgi:hypothetical protein